MENIPLTELEQRIIAYVAHQTRIKPEQIKLNSRLVHDFGVDGDDAIELFEKFSKDFNVEIRLLWNHWYEHFVPEAGGPSMGFMIVTVIAVILGGILHGAFQGIPSWAWTILLIIIFLWVHNRFFFDRECIRAVPVTVSDLVDAAKAGTWVKNYDNSHVYFRTLDDL